MHLKSLATLFFLTLIVVMAVSHVIISYPQDVKQFFYPIEAKIASTKSNCSDNSPKELYELLELSWFEGGSLANQIAYKDTSGEIHHCEGGWADEFFGHAVTVEHRYRYASLTKLITADLILQLIEEKKISLNTRLLDVFREIKNTRDSRLNDITIGNLLNHSAGFNRLTLEGDVMFSSTEKKWCPFNLNQLSVEKLNFNPGEKQIYSNVGYCLLGAVIEKITDIPFRDYAEKVYKLKSIGIKFVDDSYLPDEVKYDFRFDPMYTENYIKKYDLKAASAAVGLSGSASAMVQLMTKILARPGLNLRSSPDEEICQRNDKNEKCYGFAFVHNKESSSTTFYIHDGYLPGVTSLIVVDKLGRMVVLLNAGRSKNQRDFEGKSHQQVMQFLSKQGS